MFKLIFKHQFGGSVDKLGGWWELMCKVDTSIVILFRKDVERRILDGGVLK